MATFNVDSEQDSFLAFAEKTRGEIRDRFLRAHRVLQGRETDLLAELQRLVDEYTGTGIQDEIKQISDSKTALLATLKGNQSKDILDQSLALMDARRQELVDKHEKAKSRYSSVVLQWDENLEQRLNEAGEIRVNADRSLVPNYKCIDKPVKVFGRFSKKDKSPGVFKFPQCIAIDPVTNYCYICDAGWNNVQVFNKAFDFLFMFNEKMGEPHGIVIQYEKVYIAQYNTCCINVYTTKGELLRSIGEEGKNKLQFENPAGLDISTERNRLYISELTNNRVQCLNLDFTFNSFIEGIEGAWDVKLTTHDIVVLCKRNQCVMLFNYSHQSIRQIIPTRKGNLAIHPTHLLVDSADNILISDFDCHCVCIFSHEGVFLHKFGRKGEDAGEFINPKGLAINCEGRIIVTSDNPKHCVQIF